jgi:hypothetical protein
MNDNIIQTVFETKIIISPIQFIDQNLLSHDYLLQNVFFPLI